MLDGFHWQNGLVFKRLDNGAVRIQKHAEPKDDSPVIAEYVIDADSWASIISSVSKGGEMDNRFYTAKDFHDSKGPIAVTQR